MRFPRIPLSALALVGLLALAAPNARADRVDAVVPLKGGFEGSLDAPGEAATIGFLVTADERRKVKLSVKRARKSKLTPDVRLIAPDGTVFDPNAAGGKAKSTAKSYVAKLSGVPQSGLWKVEIRAGDGTSGGYRFAVSGVDVNKTAGSETIALGGSKSVPFVVGADCEITLKAKRARGSTVSPQLTILDPNGTPLQGGALLGTSNKSGSSLSLKKARLPVFGTYTARFSAKPGTGGSFTYVITTKPAKIKGTLPTADAGPAFEVEPGIEAHLDAVTDAGNPTYIWTQVSGEPVDLQDPNGPMPLFEAPSTSGTLAFQLGVVQAGVISRGATVAVEVARRPISDAGRSQAVATGARVTLDGTGSLDRSGAGLSFSWEQDASDAQQVTLDDATSATPSFDAPSVDAVLHFRLTADDGTARGFADEVVVAVGGGGSVADAGRNQVVPRMATVHLSGLASRSGSGLVGDALAWTQISGPGVALDGADTPFPSFTAPRQPSDLTFRVTVDGDDGTSDEVRVSVRAGETNVPGRAVAGPNGQVAGTTLALSGSSTSDPDGDALTFRWAQTFGGAAVLDDPTAANATGSTGSMDSFYAFALQANDGLQYGAPDQTLLFDAAFSGAPIADAGTDVTASAGQQVTLDGLGSRRTDGGVDPITFDWVQVSGTDWYDVAAEDLGFDPSVALPRFTLPVSVSSLTPTRTLTFLLTVDDGVLTSAPDFVTVTFTNLPLNAVPEATAGASELNPIVGAVVTLNGGATDRDGDPVTVRWTQTTGSIVQLTPGNTALAPQFTTPASGTLTFRLVANDGFDDSLPAEVVIVVDEKPVAVPTVDPTQGDEGITVTVDGSGSFDPEGENVTYKWTQAPGSQPITFSDTAASFTFTAPNESVTFRLTVNDGRQDSDVVQTTFQGAATPETNPTANLTDAAYGEQVNLRANPPAGTNFTFVWRQINPGGNDPTVSLSSTTAQNPSFNVPVPVSSGFGSAPSATFGVIAANGSNMSPEKTVTVRFFASLNTGSNRVYSIITLNCTTCHFGTGNSCSGGSVGSGSNAGGLGMATKAAFLNNNVNVNACKNSSLKRIVPNSPSTSDLVRRMKGTGGIMPAKGSLSAGQIALVEDWVLQGAKDN